MGMEITLNTWRAVGTRLGMIAVIQNIIVECEPDPLGIQAGFQSSRKQRTICFGGG